MFETNVVGPNMIVGTFEPVLRKPFDPLIINVLSEQGSITLQLDKICKYSVVRGDEYHVRKAALNMISACHIWDFEEWSCKVIFFKPGFCVVDSVGDED